MVWNILSPCGKFLRIPGSPDGKREKKAADPDPGREVYFMQSILLNSQGHP
jgi:hypothetical protein